MPDLKALESDLQECARFDPSTGKMTDFDHQKMGRVIFALNGIFMGDTDPRIKERLRKLSEVYESISDRSGYELSDAWRKAAYRVTVAAGAAMQRDDKGRYDDFATKYSAWMKRAEQVLGKGGGMRPFSGDFSIPVKPAADTAPAPAQAAPAQTVPPEEVKMPDFRHLDHDIDECLLIAHGVNGDVTTYQTARLGELIRAVRNIFMGDSDPQIETELRILDDTFEESGVEKVDTEWQRSAYQCLRSARTAMANDPKRYSDFDQKYQRWKGILSPEFGYALRPDDDTPLQRIDEPGHLDMASDIMAASVMRARSPEAAADTLAPALFIMEKHYPATVGGDLKVRLTNLREEYESGYIDSNWLDNTFKTLNEALELMDPRKASALNPDMIRAMRHFNTEQSGFYTREYKEFQERLPHAELLGRPLTDVEKKQARDVEGIRNVYARMKAENSMFHHDSPEYKAMMDRAKDIDDFVRSRAYDPSDETSRDIMQQKQKDLFSAAEKYAKKRVFGRTKSTSRGIERKNDALLLLDFSSASIRTENGELLGGYALIKEESIKDFRRSKSDKTKRSLSELLAEEKEATRRQFDEKKDMTRHPGVRRIKKTLSYEISIKQAVK